MQDAIVLDVETSGLDCLVNQTLEVAMVRVEGGQIGPVLHFYVNHPRITYDLDALIKFGCRVRDRRSEVPVVAATVARKWMTDFLMDKKWTMVAKNPAFDRGFIDQLAPGLRFRHRMVDVGNLWVRPGDPLIPNLDECRVRAISVAGPGNYLNPAVNHHALEDALQTAELYTYWLKGHTHDRP